MDSRGLPASFGVSEAEVCDAIAQQTPFVLGLLKARRWDADEVLAQIACDVIASLPRWDAAGRPTLAAWARGVATNTFRTWLRSAGNRRLGPASIISREELEDAGVDYVAEPEQADPRAPARIALAKKVEAVVFRLPDGGEKWAALVADGGRVRGTAAAAYLRLCVEIADPDGSLRRAAGYPVGREHLGSAVA